MAGAAHADESGQREIDDLLPLALSRPHEALARARAVLEGQPEPYAASVAHQAAGIVVRDIGDVQASVRELRLALRLARRTGSAERETDVLATLAAALVYAGRTSAGLAAFDQAIARSSGGLTGRVLHRRGALLWTLGRHAAALDDLRRAIGLLAHTDDRAWLARALTARGLVYIAVGAPGRADADLVAAQRLFAETGQDLESAHVVLDRALCAFALGNLPTALAHLDEAAARYRPLNVPTPALTIEVGERGGKISQGERAQRTVEDHVG